MAKKKKSLTFTDVAAEQPEIVEGFVEREVEESTSSGATRITIHVNPDGQIDWDKSKDGAADALLSAVTSDPTMLEKIADCPDLQDDAAPEGWQSDDAGLALDVLAKIEGFIAHKVMPKLGQKLDLSVALAAFNLDEKEHERQDPLAAKLLEQYLPINPAYKNLIFFLTAHSTSVLRNCREACKMQMVIDGEMPPNPATAEPARTEKPN
jgi:hypothetical protein